MIEPPSKQLRETLLKLNLCSARDFRRCRGRVRRLARDLPAFDSVWIDALLQARKLTPFQAKLLESPDPSRLCVGPCLLTGQLGQGVAATTYLARRRDGNERCVLKLIDRPPESMSSGLTSLENLIARLEGFSHPSIVAPHTALRDAERLVAVSRFVSGLHLGELLVRRGRFPSAIVIELAAQLIDGLAALEETGCLHGDVHLANVRVTSAGVAVLVDTGIRPAVAPELTVAAGHPPDRCDGIAPELIGTGNRATAASDLYALGCLLWQLLAGRPPFPSGDPLSKLAAHQMRPVGDVREWAPDTPPALAEAIRTFTEKDPADRPSTFREVRETWNRPRPAGRRRLSHFRTMFNTSAPRIPVAAHSGTSSRWPLLLTLLFVFSGAALTLLHQGLVSVPASISHRFHNLTSNWRTQEGSKTGQSGDVKNDETRASRQLLPFPAPSAAGVILLTSNGPYEAAEIEAVGELTIRGTSPHHPVIVVSGNPFKVLAEQLTLENVHVRNAGRSPQDSGAQRRKPRALLFVEAQNLTIRGCSFRTDALESAKHSKPADARTSIIAVAWKSIDANDRSGGRVAVLNTVFSGSGTSISLSAVPHQIQIGNCLKLGPGAFLNLAAGPQAGRELHAKFDRLTLRQAEALLRITLPEKRGDPGRITCEANDCVIDLAGHNAALFQLIATGKIERWLPAIEMIGEGSLANSNMIVATRLNPANQTASVLSSDSIEVEGISAGPFKFRGPFSPFPRDATIKSNSYQAPSRSPYPPGIDAAELHFPDNQQRPMQRR